MTIYDVMILVLVSLLYGLVFYFNDLLNEKIIGLKQELNFIKGDIYYLKECTRLLRKMEQDYYFSGGAGCSAKPGGFVEISSGSNSPMF